MDPQSQAVLIDVVRKEGRSLLQYVRDCFPWTTPEEHCALERLQQLIEEEEELTAQVMRFLQKQHVPPPLLGVYPGSFTTINFISLQHLVRLLVEYERRGIADLEKQLPRVADLGARVQIRQILDMKRRHLEALRKLNEPEPQGQAVAAHH